MGFFEFLKNIFLPDPPTLDTTWIGNEDKLLKARENGTIRSVIIPRVAGGRMSIWNEAQKNKLEILRMAIWEGDPSCDIIEYIGNGILVITFPNRKES